MIELAGRNYEATIGSDVQRDGMYLELADQYEHIVGEIFFSDVDEKMTLTLSQPDVPLEVVEWMIATAKVRLPPTDPVAG
ncbi:MAG: hypothetical protein EOS65_20220 [Mesorhizobium sp.]|uniref:hypothetical protein n=1 Tax=Mesorhizobium sp. TaxID=1871066 RepID=UPI000FD1C695|nr:hypothetical protein [Mesorhizobium sp.]RVC46784.1 hypothetical protein EN779_31790 [Mesorhizobium sp. M4B.F.Ca.ET.088.02.2.1]RWF29457.1 MAG: hypothetical protein EOS45_18645 [Mesorhizobium sp.]RWF39225.1 MAG: hypothetical protein EOS65_20220 [Mesorhizobium sp.]TIX17060.1 MAG: hypothetical protein E5V41_12025 [Mesorhizobium sp.]TIX35072.1 MAG: hypothetical protein E5V40_27600 [Mesorhizobium sp.]